MLLCIEDDTTPSGEEETVLTPSTESGTSFDGSESSWLFQGSLLDKSETGYVPHSAPALAMHHGRLWCLWTGERRCASPLFWTSLDSHGKWNRVQEVAVLSGGGERTVNAVGAPAIADLNGILHVVFLERNEDPRSRESPLSGRDILVHMQYDDQCQNWTKRASLGVSTGPSISLKGHAGHLYCGYVNSDQRICYSTWNEITGWSYSEPIMGKPCADQSFAFCVPGDSMHLLFASGQFEEPNIRDLEYDSIKCCWGWPETPLEVEGPFFSGFDVTNSKGRTYVIYRDRAHRLVLVTVDSRNRAVAAEVVHSEASWKIPAIAIANGFLICVWVGGPDQHKELLWSQRLTTSSVSMDKWMSRIDSDAYLSQLSIPGSHESCATIALPWIQCQHMSIDDQLKSGLRYFDFRCGVSFGSLYLFHGRSPLGFALNDVLARMYAWLERVQNEAIILQIKMEGGTGDENAFEEMLRSELTKNARLWALGNTIPRLGAVRGKIQLMRRFHTSSGPLGIDVRHWADNSPKFTIPLEQHGRLVVQDRYEYTDVVPTFAELIQTKSSAVGALIAAARHDENPRAWYLNWCNAYALSFSSGVVATPSDIAIGRNDGVGRRRQFVPGVNSSLFKKSFLEPVKGRHGTILLDFAETPEPDLVAAIVQTNNFN